MLLLLIVVSNLLEMHVMTLYVREVLYIAIEGLQEFEEDVYLKDKLSSMSLPSQLATWYW